MKRENKIKSTVNNLDIFRLLFFCLLNKLKEKQSEKVSITLKPRENSGWKEGNTSLNLLSISTKCSLIDLCWCFVRMPSKDECWLVDDGKFSSIRDQMIWLGGSEWAQSWDLLPSF